MEINAITAIMEMWDVNNVFCRKETVMDYELDEEKPGGGETNSRCGVSWNSWVRWAKGDAEDIKEALDDQATRMGR